MKIPKQADTGDSKVRLLTSFVVAVSLISGGLFAHAGPVGAVTTPQCGVTGSAATSTRCSYTSQGPDTFGVPAGVTQLTVTANGSSGSSSGDGFSGGSGAQVTANVPVSPGSTLYVQVGVGGGGAGSPGNAGAGGGLSGLYSCAAAATDPSCALLVAGGGGGAGGSGGYEGPYAVRVGGSAGIGSGSCNPGASGGQGSVDGGGGSAGGGGGTCGAGGSGGTSTLPGPQGVSDQGGITTSGLGGQGGLASIYYSFTNTYGGAGGGAGGGYYGGGGGGGGGWGAGSGGGGGASFVAANATNMSMVAFRGTPSVTFSWLIPQTVAFSSTAPTSATVDGPSYTPTANGGASTNPVVISLDSSSSGCTLANGTVLFTAAGTCVIDANQAGSTNYSAAPLVQQSITVNASGPSAPTNVVATPGNGQVSLAFTVPSNGSSSITSYVVQCDDLTQNVTNNPAGFTSQTFGAGSPPLAVTGLTNGDSYQFRVTAANAESTTDNLQPSAWTTPVAPLAPGMNIVQSPLPTAIRGSAYTATTLQVLGVASSSVGYATSVKWARVTLPKGLVLDSAGVLVGVPGRKLVAGSSSITVRVTEKVTTVIGTKKFVTRQTVRATLALTIR